MRTQYRKGAATLALAAGLLTAPAAAHADTIYVANEHKNTIEKYDSETGINLGVFASTGLTNPAALAFDTAGNLYAANYTGNIVKFTPGGVGSVFAYVGNYGTMGLAFDKAGNLYLSQFYGNWIRWCPPGGGGDYLFAWDSNQPVGLAFDGSGHLYAANSGGNNIEKYTHSGTGSVFINTGLSDPEALAFDSAGSLYVANYGSGTIEKFTPDGVGSVFANVSGPLSLAFDSAGNLYVGTWQNTIEKFTPLGVGSVFATGLGYPGAIAIQVAIKPPAPVFQSVKKTGGTLTLTWSTVAGSRYQLQCSTNSPRGSWYNLGALVLATNTVATYSDSLGSDQPQCFYRVGLLP